MRRLHQRLVHLERTEDRRALGRLVLKSHAHAHVGVHGIGVLNGGLRILGQLDLASIRSAISRALVTISISGE